ncbi:MAG TPA: L,D-transpeptidase/peptidoglycan binding protein [Actinomycetota bacterium]|nr:L,D-transpeptidase/peptidoglycan binding protein [Actinomycetota bacterium]
MARGRHGRRRIGTGAKIALIVVCVLAVTGSGVTVAAYRYDRANFDRILPGVTVGGVDVGGMTRTEAIAAVTGQADQRLSAQITIVAGDQRWTRTPAELGMRAQVTRAVEEALGLTNTLGTAERVWHRLRGEPVDVQLDVSFKTSPGPVESFVAAAADSVSVEPRDASLTVDDGDVVARHSKPGLTLASEVARERIARALADGASRVTLPTKNVKPKVTDENLGPTIIVRRDVNRLFFYEGLKLSKSYPVATAAAGYVTPPGSWIVVNKAENPTWYNPAPDTWGANLPLMIPPGPGNPLGTRALYLNAPGIRIHGTYDVNSIGTNASHGCIRMLMSDVEELYPMIPLGTPAYVV